VANVTVTFSAPGTGASGSLCGRSEHGDDQRQWCATSATSRPTRCGGPYTVTASVAGVTTPANFLLTKHGGSGGEHTATSGTPQSATINTAFAAPLVSTVEDAGR